MGYIKQNDLVTRWKNRRLQFFNFRQGQFLVQSVPSSLCLDSKCYIESLSKSHIVKQPVHFCLSSYKKNKISVANSLSNYLNLSFFEYRSSPLLRNFFLHIGHAQDSSELHLSMTLLRHDLQNVCKHGNVLCNKLEEN